MRELLTRGRNSIIRFCYIKILKPIYFKLDPETVHDRMIGVGTFLGKFSVTRAVTRMMFGYRHPLLKINLLGKTFENPIGLAAGFDKNAELVQIIPSVGFGFIEVGSITGEPCDGNPKPRLWRLPSLQSLVVYYGLKNDGAIAVGERLKKYTVRSVPLGTNIAKTNCQVTVDTAAGVADYVKAFKVLKDIGDYFTINISCPNTFGGQPFTDAEKLELLLSELDKLSSKKPRLLKISPDLSEAEIDGIISVVKKHTVDGFICTNLTKKRNNAALQEAGVPEKGGFSGALVRDAATELIRKVYTKTEGKYVIIGLGGVFNAAQAYEKIKAGASLIQLITGMIFYGPQVVSEINQGLVRLLQNDGYSSISEAIGAEHR